MCYTLGFQEHSITVLHCLGFCVDWWGGCSSPSGTVEVIYRKTQSNYFSDQEIDFLG